MSPALWSRAAIADAINASDELGLAGSSAMTNFLLGQLSRCQCGSVHDGSARCADVAAAHLATQAIIAADADLAERAAEYLAARADILFHRGALIGVSRLSLWHHLTQAIDAIDDALGDLRCAVASDRQLWDGVDPADVGLITVAALINDHRIATRL